MRRWKQAACAFFLLASVLIPASGECLAPKSYIKEAGNVLGSWTGKKEPAMSLPSEIQQMAVWELLEALRLSDPQSAEYKILGERETKDGLRLVKIRIPSLAHISGLPQGLDILSQELADTTDFYLAYNGKGYLLGAIPVIPASSYAGEKEKADIRYFDFTPYYFKVPKMDDPQAANAWAAFGVQWEKDAQILKNALHLAFEEFGITELTTSKDKWPFCESHECAFGRIQSVLRQAKPYAYVEFKKQEARPFGERSFYYSMAFKPNEFAQIAAKFDPHAHQIIVPVYPTVYPPNDLASKRPDSDSCYYSAINPGWKTLEILPGDSVLVHGPGTAIDVWLAWLKAQCPMAVQRLNPLELANTKATARLNGFEIDTDIQGKKFKWVLWNMPCYAEGPASQKPTFKLFWDGDAGGETLLHFLQKELPEELAPDGHSILWNALGERLGDEREWPLKYFVQTAMENAGFRVIAVRSRNPEVAYVLSWPPQSEPKPVEDNTPWVYFSL